MVCKKWWFVKVMPTFDIKINKFIWFAPKFWLSLPQISVPNLDTYLYMGSGGGG